MASSMVATSLLSFLVLSTTTTTQAQDPPVSSIQGQLEFDENQKLMTSHLVYPATQSPGCVNAILNAEDRDLADTFFGHGGLEGEALSRVFPNYNVHKDSGKCTAACLEKGTDKSVAGLTLPSFRYDSSAGQGDMLTWFRRSCQRVEVCFTQYVTKTEPLQIFWVDRSTDNSRNRLIKQFDLEYGTSNAKCLHSSLGQMFYAVLEDRNDPPHPKFEEQMIVRHTTTKAFGEIPHLSSQRFENEEKMLGEVKKTLGLAKGGALPNDVIASVKAFYYNNRNNNNPVEEGSSGNNIAPIIPFGLVETLKARL